MFQKFVIKIGEAGITLVDILRAMARGKLDWPETFRLIETRGIYSLPIVVISSSFIGMAISIQLAQEIVSRYGAISLVGGFVSISMVRELGPVFIAVIMVGSIGAAFTAEIASMQVEDQIDALRVFRISPLEYLVLPRIVASIISGPLLTILGTFLSILTGQLFTEYLVKIPAETFWNSVKFSIDSRDISDMLLKSLVFSLAIVLIACYNGLAAKGGSESVGVQTTQTVIWSLLAVFILNYIVTALFFQIVSG